MTSPAPRPIAARWLASIVLFQIAALAWFLVLPLPSTGAGQLRRAHLLLAADDHLRTALANLGHPENLAGRLRVCVASLFVVGACGSVGRWVLRGLRLDKGLGWAERIALSFAVGVPIVGGLTLIVGRSVGLDPMLVRGSLAATINLIVMPAAAKLSANGRKLRAGSTSDPSTPPGWSVGAMLSFAAVAGPLLALMGLGAMLPTVEFDALEYHLQGPKEFFLDGRIGPLPHNVYTSMPFAVEMLTTLAMMVVNDWWLGALAGQLVIAWCAPASAILIAATATRLAGSDRAGWWAALIYLTTPWVFRLGNTPFVEGPLALMHAALIWAVVRFGWLGLGDPVEGSERRPMAEGLLVGLIAGGALAIKYPGLISAVIPALLVALVETRRLRSGRLLVGFGVGVALAAGPWLLKNLLDHGNPVYPLAWSIFGGSDWDAVREGRWQTAHGPRPVRPDLLMGSLVDVAVRSDWQSTLYLLLVPLASFGHRDRRYPAGLLALYAAYLFATWWLLTHRLDRFWLPMLPGLAVLAGLGADALASRSRVWLALVVGVGVASNLVLCTTELAGPTAWTESYATLRDRTYREGTPSLFALDALLPPDARPLMVGQAGTFGLRHRPIYNTVFDPDTLETLARDRPPAEVAAGLHRLGVSHVYVDWAEIERYRQPGNYGFTPFIVPDVFDRLVAEGVLGPPTRLGERQILYPVR